MLSLTHIIQLRKINKTPPPRNFSMLEVGVHRLYVTLLILNHLHSVTIFCVGVALGIHTILEQEKHSGLVMISVLPC